MARTASRATSVAGAVPVLSGLLSQRRGEGVKSTFSRDAPDVRDDSDGAPRWTAGVPARIVTAVHSTPPSSASRRSSSAPRALRTARPPICLRAGRASGPVAPARADPC